MKTRQTGFTLIELIVVIVILGILSATALPKFMDLGGDARVSVIKATDGAMRSANAMLYAKAAAVNKTGASANVTVLGESVGVVYGFASNLASLRKVMDLSSDLTISGTTIVRHSGATTGTGCQVTYGVATATAPPTYTLATDGC